MEISNRESISINEKFLTHRELIFAIIAGVLIVLAWRMDAIGLGAASVMTYLSAFIIGGYEKAKEGINDTIENRTLNVEILMILAAVGSALIGYWTEGAILIFIFAISGALETYAMNRSHREISALMNIQPAEAWLVRGGFEPIAIPVEQLTIGDHILVKPGERIPADGVIFKGHSTIDESTITGESMPVTKEKNAAVFAGTVNLNGALTINVTKRSTDTMFQKIIALVESAQNEKSPSQQFIERFEGMYVKVVLAIVGLMLFLPHYILGWDWSTTFYRAMVLLVVASPCALVASVMPATLAAISNGARNGILFKGGVHLEQLGHIQTLAVDKTGTLTEGMPVVTDFIVREGLDPHEMLTTLATIEKQSSHPLAQAIDQYAKSQNIKHVEAVEIEDVPGYGIKASVNGRHYTVGKPDFVGRQDAENFAQRALDRLASDGKTVIFMRDEHGIVALAAMKDTVREEAKQAIQAIQKRGVHVVMLTGDNPSTAAVIAKESGVDEFVAECLPETKVQYVKQFQQNGTQIAMVGDGINDAPALATASVGIAMGDGTDVALETADMVLMKNNLMKIDYAMRVSQKMQRIIKQNIVFSIGIILLLIVSNFLQAISLPLGVIGHEGSTILVILNGLRMLRTA